MKTPACDLLDEYVDDELDEVSEQRFRYHLVDCVACQARLHERMQLIAALDVEAAAEGEAKVPAQRPPSPHRRTAVLFTGTVAVAGVAIAMLFAVTPSQLSAPVAAPGADAADRYLASLTARRDHAWIGRATAGGIGRHLPYDTRMAAGSGGFVVPDDVIAALEQRRDWLTVAALRTWERDVAGAERALAHLPGEDRDARNLRAALARTRGRLDLALDQLDALAAAAPDHLPSLWNRALVLADLGFELSAAEAFEQVASKSAAAGGWAQDAAGQVALLDKGSWQRYERTYDVEQAAERMVRDGVPMTVETIRKLPGFARHFFYHALNTAPSRERVLALRPVADELDRLADGKPLLREAVERTAKANFRARAPLLAQYQSLRKTSDGPASAALVAAARRTGDRLFLVGALSFVASPLPPELLREYERQANALGDPWWLARARIAHAERMIADDDPAGAQIYLGTDRCARGVEYQCALRSRLLASVDRQLRQPELALRRARDGWRAARTNGPWSIETYFLQELAAIGRQLPTASLALAATHELGLRRGLQDRVVESRKPATEANAPTRRGDEERVCGVERFRHQNAALLELERLHVESARSHLEAIRCENQTSWLTTAELLAAVHSMAPGGGEGRRARDLLAANARRATGADEATAEMLTGRVALESDPDEAAHHLHRALQLAEAGKDHPRQRSDARSDSYALLIHGAARAADWTGALRLFNEEMGQTTSPPPCTVALSQDLDRLSVVVLDAAGQARGRLEQGFRGELHAEELAKWGLLSGLESCEQVDVLARPPLSGRPGVLPADVAWRYRTGGAFHAAAPVGPPQTLVVAGVRPPPAIELAELPPWGWLGTYGKAGTTVLQGDDANPQRVLQALRSATEVLVQAHGIVDAEVSNVSYLALSPDAEGHYALTAREIRRAHLDGHPLVFLAACRAAQQGPYRRDPWSLPVAFLQAGARAVVAATGDLSSNEAERFFRGLAASVQAGRAPAVALRDARRETLRDNPRSTLRDVMLFQ